MIRVNNLRVDYDDVCAVRDLCLEVGQGEVYGLIGPNGAGKTTTLRALVGLLDPTYGDILINGIDLDHNREQATRGVGFMPDSAPIYDDLTVWEFLDLWAASYRIPSAEREATISRHLELVELTEKRDSMTAGLSRGMRQRLMLAKTLIPEPDVLLLDEPASGVDPYGRALLKDIVRGLGAAGKTVVVSSHILSELSEFCTSVGIMQKGLLVVSGRVEEVAAQVFGGREVALEIVSGVEQAEAVLMANAAVSQVERTEAGFEFVFSAGTPQLGELLTALVSAGVSVSAFTPQKGDLEAVFLTVGAREVS